MIRWLTAGESHGPALTAIIEGLPAGIKISQSEIENELARRRLGVGRGARQKFEADLLTIKGGIRHGLTMGGPVALEVANSEWPKWEVVMSPHEVSESELAGLARNAPLTRPRPGHADLAGMQKYGFDDARPVLERSSARETAARTALGAVAKAALKQIAGIEILSHVVAIGPITKLDMQLPTIADLPRIDDDPVRAFDAQLSEKFQAEIADAQKSGDTLGGVVEVLAYHVPIGLGSHVHWDRRLDSRLAGALMGIQAIKGVEVGDGFLTSTRRGSAAHDEIEKGSDGKIHRRTDRAGGIEGGITNGEILRVRAAMKPISTVPKALDTVDVASGEAAKAINQRSDVCAVPAAGVIAEAMVALTLLDALLEKTGGDSVLESARNLENFLNQLKF
jgi:chorismate synthase